MSDPSVGGASPSRASLGPVPACVRACALAGCLLLTACAPHATSQGVVVVAADTTPVDAGPDDAPVAVGRSAGGSPSGRGGGGGAAAVPADATDHITDAIGDAPLRRPAAVAVVGDSLTLSAADEIRLALQIEGLAVVGIDGVENRRMVRGGSSMPPGIDAIEELADDAVDLWVIALGTNDVGSFESAESFRSDVEQVLRSVPADDAVIWVDLWIRDRRESVVEANRILREVVQQRAGGHVVDWYAHGDDDGMITGDGVHLTERGRQVFAFAIADGVEHVLTP